MNLAYFSNVSGNTHRFIEKLGLEAARIPVTANADTLIMKEPYVLIVPTYGDKNFTNFVPRQVKKFLQEERNQENIKGVIASGNTNFGKEFAIAGRIISQKFHVPYLYRFELMGTPEDVKLITQGLEEFWKQQ